MGSVNVRVLIVATFAAGLVGCKSDSPLDPLERASTIEAASAVDFSGVVGTLATSAPTVRVTDEDGDAVGDVPVKFAVTAGGGFVNASIVTVVTTDRDGRASAKWTLGKTITTNTVTASVGALAPVTFKVEAGAGPPTTLERTSGNNQIVAVGAVLGSPLTVRLLDSYQNPVSGVTVSFSVVSGGGTITPASATSDSTGFVSGHWTVGPVDGIQTARAQAAGMTVVFSADAFNCPGQTSPTTCLGLEGLLFVRSLDGQIYRMSGDGIGLTKLTSEGNNQGPAWSPDGNRIAFTRFMAVGGSGTRDVYLMNADGSNPVRLTTGASFSSVTWSPDGRRLAMEGTTAGDSLNIYTIAVDSPGSPTVLIGNGASPSWSPDGKLIAYAHGTGYYDASQIYLVNADGSGSHRATADSSGWNWDPAWSPDGQKISFSRCASSCGVHTMNSNGTALTLVASGGFDAAWSPDGKWLALTVYGSGPPYLNYVQATGGTVRILLTDAFEPSWRPAIH